MYVINLPVIARFISILFVLINDQFLLQSLSLVMHRDKRMFLHQTDYCGGEFKIFLLPLLRSEMTYFIRPESHTRNCVQIHFHLARQK